MTFEDQNPTQYTQEQIEETYEREELEYTKPFPNQLKPIIQKPKFRKRDLHIIAWVLAFNGKMKILKHRNRYLAKITIRHSNFELINKFSQIIRVGEKGLQFRPKPPLKATKAWQITNFHEILFLLTKVAPYIRARRTKRIAQIITEFCRSRITQYEEAQKEPSPYNERELEITKTVEELNTPRRRSIYEMY